MTRKQKRQQGGSNESGQSSPQGSQTSPGTKGGAGGGGGGKSTQSTTESPKADFQREKQTKKQKQSPSMKTPESGRGKQQSNGRDSSDSMKKQAAKQKGKPPQGMAPAKIKKSGQDGCCSAKCCIFLFSGLVAMVAVGVYVAHYNYPQETEEVIAGVHLQTNQVYRTVRDWVDAKLDEVLKQDEKTKDEKEPFAHKASTERQHQEETAEDDEETADQKDVDANEEFENEMQEQETGTTDEETEEMNMKKIEEVEEEPIVEQRNEDIVSEDVLEDTIVDTKSVNEEILEEEDEDSKHWETVEEERKPDIADEVTRQEELVDVPVGGTDEDKIKHWETAEEETVTEGVVEETIQSVDEDKMQNQEVDTESRENLDEGIEVENVEAEIEVVVHEQIPQQEVPQVVEDPAVVEVETQNQQMSAQDVQRQVVETSHEAPAQEVPQGETVQKEEVPIQSEKIPEVVESEITPEKVSLASNEEIIEESVVFEENVQHESDTGSRENLVHDAHDKHEVVENMEQAQQEIVEESPEGVETRSQEDEAAKVAEAENQLALELDRIDSILDQLPRDALEMYTRVATVFPDSSRAVIGRAKALGILADMEQNDALLEQSIAEYQKVFNLPSVSKDVMLEAGRTCAEKQTVRGWGNEAAQTLRSLVSMYPDDLVLHNELGQKYLMIGAYEHARATFKEILNKDPKDAFAMLYLGFIMKLVDRDLSQSLDYMKAGLVTVPVSDLKFYIELGEALTRAGRHNEAHEVYQLAVDRTLLKSVWQRSWYNIEGLTARPWWTLEQTHNLINLQVLEDFKSNIKDEALNIAANISSLFLPSGGDIVESGELRHLKLYVNGRKMEENCNAAVKTCSLLEPFSDAINCKQCEVKISLMQPGLHLWPHCGPTNSRLTAQLPLIFDHQTRIRVADQTRTYTPDRFIVFDDSFEQELWVMKESQQLVLTVEMWHPDLSPEQKSTLGPL